MLFVSEQVDEDFIAAYQASYGVAEEQSSAAAAAHAAASASVQVGLSGSSVAKQRLGVS